MATKKTTTKTTKKVTASVVGRKKALSKKVISKPAKVARKRSTNPVKNKGGRPTKLDKNLCKAIEKLVGEWDPFKNIDEIMEDSNNALVNGFKIMRNFLSLSTHSNLAYKLNITRSTLNNYMNGEGSDSYDQDLLKRFLDTVEGWDTKRGALIMEMMPFFAKTPSIYILFLKNIQQFTDAVRFGNVEGETFEISESIRRVQKSSVPKIAKSIERAQKRVH